MHLDSIPVADYITSILGRHLVDSRSTRRLLGACRLSCSLLLPPCPTPSRMTSNTSRVCQTLLDPARNERCRAPIAHPRKLCCEAHEGELDASYSEYKAAASHADKLRLYAQLKRSKVHALDAAMVDFHIDGLHDYVEALEREIRLRVAHGQKFFLVVDEGHRRRVKKLQRDLRNTKLLQRDLEDRKHRLAICAKGRGRATAVARLSAPHTRNSSPIPRKRRRRRERRKHEKRPITTETSRIAITEPVFPPSEPSKEEHDRQQIAIEYTEQTSARDEDDDAKQRERENQLWLSWIEHFEEYDGQDTSDSLLEEMQRSLLDIAGLPGDVSNMGIDESIDWHADTSGLSVMGDGGMDAEGEVTDGEQTVDSKPIPPCRDDSCMEAAPQGPWEGTHLEMIAMSGLDAYLDTDGSVDYAANAPDLGIVHDDRMVILAGMLGAAVALRLRADVVRACLDVLCARPNDRSRVAEGSCTQNEPFDDASTSYDRPLSCELDHSAGRPMEAPYNERGASLDGGRIPNVYSPAVVPVEAVHPTCLLFPLLLAQDRSLTDPSIAEDGFRIGGVADASDVPQVDFVEVRDDEEALEERRKAAAGALVLRRSAYAVRKDVCEDAESEETRDGDDGPGADSDSEVQAQTRTECEHEAGDWTAELDPGMAEDALGRGRDIEAAGEHGETLSTAEAPPILPEVTLAGTTECLQSVPGAYPSTHVDYVARGSRPSMNFSYGAISDPQGSLWDVDVEEQLHPADDDGDHPPRRGRKVIAASILLAAAGVLGFFAYRSPRVWWLLRLSWRILRAIVSRASAVLLRTTSL
ncbi:hypothetical protein PYCCODRAFT_1282071 [Trametes coccinea BRFM310]|uniref:Uncharacterized protein n=1 Tax=Trametes coccinea (strain BRFM310) TaxID=1353009 RepID=A0A1Y2IV92_TRAC3|nr:hypothetical protein PYCCODRAFT_1282071 [Trametes coccinea BRFM310]